MEQAVEVAVAEAPRRAGDEGWLGHVPCCGSISNWHVLYSYRLPFQERVRIFFCAVCRKRELVVVDKFGRQVG